ncbi:MAG: hypothetical protein ABEI78_01880 [Candidatus Nanohaloarchaea archaeon]
MNDEQVLEVLKDIRSELKKLNKKYDELSDSNFNSEDQNILEKYDRETRSKFMKRVRDAGDEGLNKREIGEIFGVEETRAYGIQNKLASQISRIIYEKQGGNKPGLTKHEKHAYADAIAKENSVDKDKVLDEIRQAAEESNLDEYEILRREYQKLEEGKPNRKKRNQKNSGAKAIL